MRRGPFRTFGPDAPEPRGQWDDFKWSWFHIGMAIRFPDRCKP